eukprot:13491950-Ditylum_brightwellii.AAC.1
MAMITQTQQIIKAVQMQMRPVNIVSTRMNYQLTLIFVVNCTLLCNVPVVDSTWNNTDLPLEETSEVEKSNNASTDSSVESEVNTNVPGAQAINKKPLFGLNSSGSSES